MRLASRGNPGEVQSDSSSDSSSSDEDGNENRSSRTRSPQRKRPQVDFQQEVAEAVRHCIPEVVQAVVSNIGLQRGGSQSCEIRPSPTSSEHGTRFSEGDFVLSPLSLSCCGPEDLKRKVIGSSTFSKTDPQCTPSANTNSRRAFDEIKTLTTKYETFALAAETRQNYNRGANAYVDFCLQLGLTDEQRRILAVNENDLMYFAAHCAGFRGLAPGTIHNYLYGIRNWYITRGLQDPLKHSNGQPLYRLSRVLRGIKKCHELHAKKRLPITIQILRALVDLFSSGCFGLTEDRMMLAVVNLAVFGFPRCGKFTVLRSDQFDPSRNLLVKDVTFFPNYLQPTYLTVTFALSILRLTLLEEVTLSLFTKLTLPPVLSQQCSSILILDVCLWNNPCF